MTTVSKSAFSFFTLSLVAIFSFATLFVATPSEASLNLPPPQELMTKASKDRRALREVLLDMQLNIPEMRDPQTFDGYFFLLSDMEKLAEKFKLDEIFPKAVQQTGLKMVGHGIRWLDLAQRPADDALYYLRYADGDVLRRLLEETEIFARGSTDEIALRHIASNLEVMLPVVERQMPDRRDIQKAFRELLSSIAIRFLNAPKVSDADAAFWISKISLPSAYSEYLGTLNDVILDTRPTETNVLASLAVRLLELGKKIESESYPLPEYIKAGWGDATIELMLRSIQGERVFAKGEFEALIKMMRSRQLQSLSSQWLSTERLPTLRYADAYLTMSKQLIDQLRAVGLSKQAAEIASHISRMAAPIQGTKVQIEGFYSLKAKDGTPFQFSIVRARNNLLVAALAMDGGVVTKAYFNVTFDTQSNRFVASQREPDLDSNPNPMLYFTVSEKGAIEIEDPISQWRKMSGRKTGTYTNFLDDESSQPNPTEGNWEGEMKLKNHVMKARLTITRFGGYSLGRLTTKDGLQFDFQIGSTGTNSVVYLTTGYLRDMSWIQIRAIRRGDFLEGQMISGAKGITVPYFKLKKVAQ